MRLFLSSLILVLIVSPVAAQYAPGSIGNAGRLPEGMTPGALPPPPMPAAPTPSAPATSYGARYPNTQSLSRDRIESQGYRVKRITPQNDGSWNADVTRDTITNRPGGVPSKITIFPDGRILEERTP